VSEGANIYGHLPALDHRDRVQRFVLRARKVMDHSLVREHLPLLNKLAKGTFDLHVKVNRKTREGSHRLRLELPPEEAFESFAVRLRPFNMSEVSELDLSKWKSVHEDPQIMALIERRRDAAPEADAQAG
jgi:hypothetical protein